MKTITIKLAEILKAAGWRDNCDAQWAGIESAIPEIRDLLDTAPQPPATTSTSVLDDEMPALPQGYKPHEIPADYTGPLFIEGQMRRYGFLCGSKIKDAQSAQIKHLEHRLAVAMQALNSQRNDAQSVRDDVVMCPNCFTRHRGDIVFKEDAQSVLDAVLEPVEGDLLPSIESQVLIHLARQDKWVPHTVIGYYVWPAHKNMLKGEVSNLYRVFIRVKDAEGYENARLLGEVRRIDAAMREKGQQ